MSSGTLVKPSIQPRDQVLPVLPNYEGRLYAITFDMDVESLKLNYGDPYNNAYAEIRKVLQRQGFTWQQGSVYFGGETINAVTCVLAALELSRTLPWFAASVRDIRMLRIEENNDLMPAVQQAMPGI
ncbi:MAG: virulence factor [Isosphaeraceae bacterium]